MNKYKNVSDRGFHSKLESAVYDILRMREMAGEIKILKCQARVTIEYPKGNKWVCIPDFLVVDLKTNQEVYVESKGFEGERWSATCWIWSAHGPAPMEVWKGNYKRPYLDETIIPHSIGIAAI